MSAVRDDAYRSRVIRWTLFVCLVIWSAVLVTMISPGAGALVMPGPLTHAHASLGDRCAHCHAGQQGDVKGPLHGLVGSDMAMLESRLCMRCHDFGPYSLHAHARDPEELALTTQRLRPHASQDPPSLRARLQAHLGALPHNTDLELACSTCHREHRGAEHDLRAMSSAACQACHVERDGDLHAHHREFTRYPARRRTRIVFSHERHRNRYFEEASLAFRCVDCHAQDEQGFMRTVAFEAGCRSCHHHVEQIEGKGRDQAGIAFFRFPGLDLEALEEDDLTVGEWPADGADEYEAPGAVFADLLLAGDPEYARCRADRAVLASVDPSDLIDASAEEKQAAERYGWALKRLLRDLGRDPRATIAARLEALGWNSEVDRAALADLSGALSRVAFQAIADRWTPALNEELANASSRTVAEQVPADGSFEAQGHWMSDDDDMSLRFVPARHRSAFLKAWHDLLLRHEEDPITRPAIEFLLGEDMRCTKCHGVEPGMVRWRAARPSTGRRPVRFSKWTVSNSTAHRHSNRIH